jgi:hypothetical protein
MRLLVISPTGHPPFAERMIATARRVGIEPMLYGLNSNHPHGKDYQGTDIVNILTERTDADYVMGVDAPDVAFVGGEEEILAKLNTFHFPFVVSAEHDGVRGIDRLQEELHRQCINDGGYFPQMNIGAWIGQREYALKCFNEAERLYKDRPENPDYNYDNHFQYLAMMKAWGGMPFQIDWHCVIFQSMNKANTKWLPEIHFNGDPTREAYGAMVKEILS